MNAALVAAGIFVILNQLSGCDAINCYQCTYNSLVNIASEPACKDPVTATDLERFSQSCAPGFICGKGKYESGDAVVIMRFCAPRSCDSGASSGYDMGFTCCDQNKCNGGNVVRVDVMMSMAAALVALLAAMYGRV